ncbi:MAG: hypothetical protein J6M02_06230 [Clostridia bacterium]|nr:hypothetical protein [Clostridia bacterium]
MMLRYNGSRENGYFTFSGDPAQLVPGQVYKLLSKVVHAWHTEYFLEGIPGSFNSVWFDEVDDETEPKVFLALAKEVPVVGERYECWKIESNAQVVCWSTSPVVNIKVIRTALLQVTTRNSIYLVQMIC